MEQNPRPQGEAKVLEEEGKAPNPMEKGEKVAKAKEGRIRKYRKHPLHRVHLHLTPQHSQ